MKIYSHFLKLGLYVDLVVFYGISTLVGYFMPNHADTYFTYMISKICG